MYLVHTKISLQPPRLLRVFLEIVFVTLLCLLGSPTLGLTFGFCFDNGKACYKLAPESRLDEVEAETTVRTFVTPNPEGLASMPAIDVWDGKTPLKQVLNDPSGRQVIVLYGIPDDTGTIKNMGRPGDNNPSPSLRALFDQVQTLPVFAHLKVVYLGHIPPAPVDHIRHPIIREGELGNRYRDNIEDSYRRVIQVVTALREINPGLIFGVIGGDNGYTYPVFYPFTGTNTFVALDNHLDARTLDPRSGSADDPRLPGPNSGTWATLKFTAPHPDSRLLPEQIWYFGTDEQTQYYPQRSAWLQEQGVPSQQLVTVEAVQQLSREGRWSEIVHQTMRQTAEHVDHLHVMLDIDTVDVREAPGRSAIKNSVGPLDQQQKGISGADAEEFAHAAGVAGASLLDIMEVAPALDRLDQPTSKLAAKLFGAFLRGWEERLVALSADAPIRRLLLPNPEKFKSIPAIQVWDGRTPLSQVLKDHQGRRVIAIYGLPDDTAIVKNMSVRPGAREPSMPLRHLFEQLKDQPAFAHLKVVYLGHIPPAPVDPARHLIIRQDEFGNRYRDNVEDSYQRVIKVVSYLREINPELALSVVGGDDGYIYANFYPFTGRTTFTALANHLCARTLHPQQKGGMGDPRMPGPNSGTFATLQFTHPNPDSALQADRVWYFGLDPQTQFYDSQRRRLRSYGVQGSQLMTAQGVQRLSREGKWAGFIEDKLTRAAMGVDHLHAAISILAVDVNEAPGRSAIKNRRGLLAGQVPSRGISSQDTAHYAHAAGLAGASLLDVMEVAPALDPPNQPTSRLAARLIHEFLAGWEEHQSRGGFVKDRMPLGTVESVVRITEMVGCSS